MTKSWSTCLLSGLIVTALLAAALPAEAQYKPIRPKKAVTPTAQGEKFVLEVNGNFWYPTPVFVASADGLGVKGSTIDASADLGIAKKWIWDVRAVLKLGAHHKLLGSYLPLQYSSVATLKADITFNGVTYPLNAQVASNLSWKTYRVGYEYDYVTGPEGFLGLILQVKISKANIALSSIVGDQVAAAQAPIPAIGTIGRFYISKGVSLTGELSYFKLPSSWIPDATGHHTEYDIYLRYNPINNAGIQIGYRKIDIGVEVKDVNGQVKMGGFYAGAMFRF